ncbi:MAG: 3'-5' exonuclease [Christensenellaceae bacterium]|jgi:DNA polymerase III epsilon subunit-like protein|nr:3'-5' exonuclease [Christensenellaceae bacterium]
MTKAENGTFNSLFNVILGEEKARLFKLSEAEVAKNDSVTIRFVINAADYDSKLTPALKKEVESAVREMLPGRSVFFNYEKTISDEGHIKKLVATFTGGNFPNFWQGFQEGASVACEIKGDFHRVVVAVPEFMYSYCQSADYANRLEEYLDANLVGDVKVILDKTARELSGVAAVVFESEVAEGGETFSADIYADVFVEAAETENIFGGMIIEKARWIKDIIKKEQQRICAAARLVHYDKLTAKKSGTNFYKMVFTDGTDTLKAVYFPSSRKKDERARNEALRQLCDNFEDKVREGQNYLVYGDVKFNEYDKGNSMTINSLSFADVNLKKVQDEFKQKEREAAAAKIKPCPTSYAVISPKPYEEEVVVGDLFFAEEEEIYDELKGEIVFFDLETTDKDKYTSLTCEFCAALVVDGRIVETLETLVNPECHIGFNASEVNHIYDKDVKNSPKFSAIAGDIYRFINGKTLAGHNIDGFDMPIIKRQLQSEGYVLPESVRTIDTLTLARRLRGNKGNSLAEFRNRLGIDALGAHRAAKDVIDNVLVYKELLRLQRSKK